MQVSERFRARPPLFTGGGKATLITLVVGCGPQAPPHSHQTESVTHETVRGWQEPQDHITCHAATPEALSSSPNTHTTKRPTTRDPGPSDPNLPQTEPQIHPRASPGEEPRGSAAAAAASIATLSPPANYHPRGGGAPRLTPPSCGAGSSAHAASSSSAPATGSSSPWSKSSASSASAPSMT